MSIISEAEGTVEALVPQTRVLALIWEFAPWAIAAVLLALLLITRGTLHDVRLQAKLDAANAAAASSAATAAGAAKVRDAVETYAAKAAALQPVIVRSTDTVRTYAQTSAGAASCDAAERVRGIDALDAELFHSGAPGGGDGPVPADAGPPPARR